MTLTLLVFSFDRRGSRILCWWQRRKTSQGNSRCAIVHNMVLNAASEAGVDVKLGLVTQPGLYTSENERDILSHPGHC